MLLSACSKKTYRADSNTYSHQIKNLVDTSAHKLSSTTDKTVTVINRSIDTNITIAGKALSGYLIPAKLAGKDTSAHFENEDLTLLLHIDKRGKTTATAIPKSKTVKVKAHVQTAVYNNIVKTENSDVNIKHDLAIKTSLAEKRTKKQTESSSPFNLSLLIMLLIACVVIWLVNPFSFLRKLFG